MLSITFLAFRGIGFRRDPDVEPLINAGHVGILLPNDPCIYGFHPSQEAIHAYEISMNRFGLVNVTQFLKDHGALRGEIFDDTAVFHRAAALAHQGEQTTVWQWQSPLSSEQLDEIKQALATQLTTAPLLWYRFPNRDGSPMPEQCNNCATWPRTLTITIREPSGQLRDLIPFLEAEGTPWTP